MLDLTGDDDDPREVPSVFDVSPRVDNQLLGELAAMREGREQARGGRGGRGGGSGGGGGSEAASVPPMPRNGGRLQQLFVVPPFSVLDAKQGYWQERKRQWHALGIDSGAGRDANLLGMARLQPGGSGTSLFDPVLAEVALRWWAPMPEKHPSRPTIVLDPFAGGSVRGIVAAKLGYLYVGIDLSQRQIDANNAQRHVTADCRHQPVWVQGDGEQVRSLFARVLQQHQLRRDTPADFVLTCPPYLDLEVYSHDDNDLSNMSPPAFEAKYRRILAETIALLRPRHFACIVTGSVRARGGSGELIDLERKTLDACEAAGGKHFNKAVLTTALGSAPMRASRQMGARSALVSVHQPIVVVAKDAIPTSEQVRAAGIRAARPQEGEGVGDFLDGTG